MSTTEPKARGRARGRGRPTPTPTAADSSSEQVAVGNGGPEKENEPLAAAGRASYRSSTATSAAAESSVPGLAVELENLRISPPAAAAKYDADPRELRANPLARPVRYNKPGGPKPRRGQEEEIDDNYDTFPTRPHDKCKQGNFGRPTSVVTNFVKIQSSKTFLVYQYHVQFAPAVDSIGIRKALINEHRDVVGHEYLLSVSILFTKTDIGEELKLTSKHPRQDTDIFITLRRTRSLPPTDPTCLTIFNICNRKVLATLGYRQMGRHFFDPSQSINIPAYHVHIWPGFNTSIRSHDESLLLGLDLIHKVVRSENVYQFLMDLHTALQQRRTPAMSDEEFYAEYRRKASNSLVGTSVVLKYNDKTVRIDEILWEENPTMTFQKSDGSEISYLDYYQQHYNCQIMCHDQPMLLSLAKKRGIKRGKDAVNNRGPAPKDQKLVPELCSMTGMTDTMRGDRTVMRAMAAETRATPSGRIERATGHINKIHSESKALNVYSNWGLELEKEMLEATARLLPPEILTMGGKTFQSRPEEADWSQKMRNLHCTTVVNLERWVIVFSPNERRLAEQFYAMAQDLSSGLGLSIAKPFTLQTESDRVQGYIDAIKSSSNAVQRETGQNPQIVVAVVPNDLAQRYQGIKKLCCLELAVPAQVVNAKTLNRSKAIGSIVTKVVLQMSCKLGGALWTVVNPLKKAMVVGYDAYHDSQNKRCSAGAAVFSMNPELTKWYSQCSLHTESQELTNNLTLFMTKALKCYHQQNNGDLPTKVIFYRDGVGEGQIPVVHGHEIPQIVESFKRISPDYTPELVFIVVNKRCNVRFFEKRGSGLINPSPGTVLDTKVTLPERFDFFMVPQNCRTGTVSPVSFNVLRDETNLDADQIQRFTYKLCHLYYNWQGTVRVPAPCLYAHKLAFLVGQSLHQQPHPDLSDRLYFL